MANQTSLISSGLSSRRDCLRQAVAVTVGSAVAATPALVSAAPSEPPANPFRYCFNTSTVRGQKLSIEREVDLAAHVGYSGIEPWARELEEHRNGGGSLADLKKRIGDAGLTVEDVIAFPTWCVDDETQRKQGIETFKRDADLAVQIGALRIAAPPAGANRTDAPPVDLAAIAERYAALLEIGRGMGIQPVLEFWGSSKNLSRLSEATFVAVQCGQPDATILPDIYHLYRGGSDFAGLNLLAGSAIPVIHVNDYPTNRPRTELSDADRVYPGDGQAPMGEIFRTLAANGCRAALSLELFNKTYWEQDAETVARLGLMKTKAAVETALAQTN